MRSFSTSASLGTVPVAVAVGGGDDADVDGVRLRRADRPHLHLLEHPQELYLETRRQLGDLVEEDRAVVGAAEEAERVGHRAREGAADVTEELGLEQVLGNRATVHGNERPLRAR